MLIMLLEPWKSMHLKLHSQRQVNLLSVYFDIINFDHSVQVFKCYLNQNFISTQKGPGVPPTRGRGVFPVTALMSHGCVSNARYIMIVDNSDEGNIRVRPNLWLCVNLFCNITHMQLRMLR